MKRFQKTAKQSIAERAAEAREAIAKIEAACAALEATEEPTWGHAGDAAHAAQTLEELAGFLGAH